MFASVMPWQQRNMISARFLSARCFYPSIRKMLLSTRWFFFSARPMFLSPLRLYKGARHYWKHGSEWLGRWLARGCFLCLKTQVIWGEPYVEFVTGWEIFYTALAPDNARCQSGRACWRPCSLVYMAVLLQEFVGQISECVKRVTTLERALFVLWFWQLKSIFPHRKFLQLTVDRTECMKLPELVDARGASHSRGDILRATHVHGVARITVRDGVIGFRIVC